MTFKQLRPSSSALRNACFIPPSRPLLPRSIAQVRYYGRQGMPLDFNRRSEDVRPLSPLSRSASTVDIPRRMQQKPEKTFSFPPGTTFRAWSKDEGLAQVSLYREALYKHGVAKIQCEFGGTIEDKSALLLEIVEALGKADTHSATEGALWDIKNKPEGVISKGTGQKAVAISHTLDEFSWHIDGSFEEKPTRFFGFHIIHPDKQGGGVFRLLPVADIVAALPPDVTEILATKEFNIKVPPEFFKGVHTLRKPLLERPANGPALIRYRKGVTTADENDKEAVRAIRVLESLLGKEDTGFAVPAEHFKEDTLLLLDNRRFLHSRTAIRDPNRWLRRVRFHADSAAA